MSEGNPEKVAASMKVYQNTIIGVVICFMAVIITQLVFLAVGITASPFEFNIIPKYGYKVKVTLEDEGRYCFVGQVDISKNGFKCDPDTNKWTK